MHVVIEKARKAAGISGLKKNYPDSPRERGCGYWAAFIGSISNDLATRDQERLDLTERNSKELKSAHLRIEELEAELRHVKDHSISTGVELIRHQENWSIEKGRDVLKTIAG